MPWSSEVLLEHSGVKGDKSERHFITPQNGGMVTPFYTEGVGSVLSFVTC